MARQAKAPPKAAKKNSKVSKLPKRVGRSKQRKSQALAELLIEVCDKVGVTVSQEVWLIAKGVPKKK